MSTANAMPPLLPASISDCIIAPASMNWRKLWTGGKPGRVTAPPAPPVWIASSRGGEITIGAISCGRRKVWRIERMPSARTTLALTRIASNPVTSDRGSKSLSISDSSGIRGSRGVGRNLFLQVVACLGDEDVVEGGADQLQ